MDALSNLFLAGLSAPVRDEILSNSNFIDLPVQTVLFRPDRTPRFVYFLTTGLASVVAPVPDGESILVEFIGREGLVGALHQLGQATISMQCVMQHGGTGIEIPFDVFQGIYASNNEVHAAVLAFVQAQAITVAQLAGCNRLHNIEQRLTRWLLMAQDRTQSEELEFTQGYLSKMLATQRSTVTIAASKLKKRGCIAYSRGVIQVVDRTKLEQLACGCYHVIKNLYASSRNNTAAKAMPNEQVESSGAV